MQKTENNEVKKDSKKNIIALMGLFGLVILIVGFTYAYWTFSGSQTTTNILQTDCLDVDIEDVEDSYITLNNQFPITDDQAQNLRPYTFKLTNKCNKKASYELNLEVINSSSLLSSEYIATKINDETKKLLNSYTEVAGTYRGQNDSGVEEVASKAYKIKTGTIDGSSSETLQLRLWLNDSVTLDDDVQNKTFKSKLSVTSEIYKEPTS